MTTGHCSVWLDGCHSQPVPYSNNTGCPIDVCQQEQLETVWNQWDLSQGELWLEFMDMAQYPLVRREPVSASCSRRPDEGLETKTYSLYPKEHPANCPLRWRVSNDLGVYLSWLQAGFSHHTSNLTGDQYIRDVLQPVVVPHFDNHPLATRPVYMDDNTRPHLSRAVAAYFQSEAVTAVPWPAMSPDLNPIKHIWDMVGRRIHAR